MAREFVPRGIAQAATAIRISTPAPNVVMKTLGAGVLILIAVAAWAMPLGTNSRAIIPAEVQQVISVDYRALKDSPTAQALKQQVLPESLKQFESALKGIGIDTEKDLEQLTFAAYRMPKSGIQVV